MDADLLSPATGDDRLLGTLQRLLGIASPELRPALDQASNLVAEALRAERDLLAAGSHGDRPAPPRGSGPPERAAGASCHRAGAGGEDRYGGRTRTRRTGGAGNP